MSGAPAAGAGPFKGLGIEGEEVEVAAIIVVMDVLLGLGLGLIVDVVAGVVGAVVTVVKRAAATLGTRRRQPRRVARAVTGPPLAQPPERA